MKLLNHISQHHHITTFCILLLSENNISTKFFYIKRLCKTIPNFIKCWPLSEHPYQAALWFIREQTPPPLCTVSTKKELPQKIIFFWNLKFCLKCLIWSLLTVTYLLSIFRIFRPEAPVLLLGITFIQRFSEAFSLLVFRKVLVRNFISFFLATPKVSVFCQPALYKMSLDQLIEMVPNEKAK